DKKLIPLGLMPCVRNPASGDDSGGGSASAGGAVMAKRARAALLRAIRSSAIESTDQELLARFTAGDERAFAALVERHSSLVLGVCRRALPTVQDAEDACQATFLILARKAKAMRWQPSIANWLYTTARRVASRANRAASRRVRRESHLSTPAVP